MLTSRCLRSSHRHLQRLLAADSQACDLATQPDFTPSPPPPDTTASFGYEDIPEREKTARVGAVFSSVSTSYDTMNDAMSLGLHRLWKDRLISKLNPFPGMQHLDVAGGTGDVAFRIAARLEQLSDPDSAKPGSVTVCDINEAMLQQGRTRASNGMRGGNLITWIAGDAEQLPFPNAAFDSYTIAFGIRNVTRIQQALHDAARVLKSGGRFMCLEFSHVEIPVLKDAYDAYSFHVIPKIGKAIANDEASYQYLVESIRRFPSRETFASMLSTAGLQQIDFEILTGGVVALHSGYKL